MRRLLLATTAAAFVASAGSAMAESANDSFTVSATTQEALTVTCNQDLSFGTFAISNSNPGGNVTVSNDGNNTTATTDTGVVIVSDGTAAECVVAGEDGGDATANLSSSTGVTLTHTNGTDTLTADLSLSTASGITNETLRIGGTLTVPADFDGVAGNEHGTYTSAAITLTVTD